METRIPGMRNDRENGRKCCLKTFIAPLRRWNFRLQKARIRLYLRRQKKGNVEDVGPLGKALANALLFSIGIGHGGSVRDSDIEGQKTGLTLKGSALSCNPRINSRGMGLNRQLKLRSRKQEGESTA
jgi:hypothetical protein